MTHNDPSKLLLNSTVRLTPGLTAAVRQKLVDAFGSDDPYAATKADWAFEDLVASLLLDWLQKDAPVPDEIIQKWQKTTTLPEPGLPSLRAYEVERSDKQEKTLDLLKGALDQLASDIHCGSRGGNWQSPLWFCGYEPGGYLSDGEGHQYTDLDRAYCRATDLGFLRPQARIEALSFPYARKLAGFMNVFMGWADNASADQNGLIKAVNHGLFASSEQQGIGCDCNLYPVQRPSHQAWRNLGVIYQGVDFGQFGDYDLPSYPDFILKMRRDAFRKHFENELKHHPIVIIANGQLNQFLEVLRSEDADKAVSPQVEDLTENVQVVSLGFGAKHRYDVTLVAMPHFGSHGLTLEVLEKRARIIRNYLIKHDTEDHYWRDWFKQCGQREVTFE